jgi:hypothetical protein
VRNAGFSTGTPAKKRGFEFVQARYSYYTR